MEDTKLEEIMDEEEVVAQEYEVKFQPQDDLDTPRQLPTPPGESLPIPKSQNNAMQQVGKIEIRTLNGELVDDEFLADAINYEFLIEKIDMLLDKLQLDA